MSTVIQLLCEIVTNVSPNRVQVIAPPIRRTAHARCQGNRRAVHVGLHCGHSNRHHVFRSRDRAICQGAWSKTTPSLGFGVLPIRALLYTLIHNPAGLIAVQVLDG